MTGIRITGWGIALPDKVVTNNDMAVSLDTSDCLLYTSDRGRFPHACREGLFQGADGRVLPVVVVTDHGLGHGAAHGGRGAGDRVTAKVDDIGHAATLTMRPVAFGGARASP